MKRAKGVVCSIFWFELHARRLDCGARQEASVGILWGEIPASGTVVLWAMRLARVADLRDGGIKQC